MYISPLRQTEATDQFFAQEESNEHNVYVWCYPVTSGNCQF